VKGLLNDEARYGLRIAPLIDIVFLLLIFFLVATTFKNPERDLSIRLPTADRGTDRDTEPALVIDIRASGDVLVEGNVLTPSELRARLGALGPTPRGGVVIRCDRKTDHEYFVYVLDACRDAGVENLSVATHADP
jgi:biopolymer transport protein ExbD